MFAATNEKSGTVTVSIYSGIEVNSANRVQGIIANTYFDYTIGGANATLYQVPIINAHDLDYGTYTVVVMPRYNKALDVSGTGKCGVYVDSVRIYDPMGEDEDANNVYMENGEFAPEYLEIRDTLVHRNADGSYTITNNGHNSSVFIDGTKNTLEDFAKVELLDGSGLILWYLTDGLDLDIDDIVLVPVGATNQRIQARVIRIDKGIREGQTPVPLTRAKKIIKKDFCLKMLPIQYQKH